MTIDANKLNTLIMKNKWSVAELARRSGVTKLAIGFILNGKTKTTRREVVGKLAEALNVEPGELLQDETRD